MELSPGDRQGSRRIVHYLVRLPVIDRIKVVKDLVVNQLSGLQATSNALLANNTPLLEAMINLAQTLQETRHEIRQHSALAMDAIHRLADTLEVTQREIQELSRFVRAAPQPAGSPEPEAALMAHLYSFLPDRCALDVGAHVGEISEPLLDAGFEVHAFEPYPPIFSRLTERLGCRPGFRAHPWAIGETDGTKHLHIVLDKSGTDWYRDVTLLSSLVQHALPSGLVFAEGHEVTVKSLDTLHRAGIIPARVGLVKIDTEGFDLPVVRGMGSHRYPVVVCEYWDSRMPFGGSKGVHSLEDMVREMRSRQYYWYIVFYRIYGRDETRFYCNFPCSLEGAWGNVFFFQDHETFLQAQRWCAAVLPSTNLWSGRSASGEHVTSASVQGARQPLREPPSSS
jgi:FkbM family methyltransferase